MKQSKTAATINIFESIESDSSGGFFENVYKRSAICNLSSRTLPHLSERIGLPSEIEKETVIHA
jgi:hypothetical protein